MTATQRLALPFILPGQAQKEMFHNEALQTLDVLVAGAVEEGPRTDPPSVPALGSCFIVGTAATGDWGEHDGQVAAYTSAGWRFIAPVEGMTLHVRSTGDGATYRNGGWEVGVLRGGAIVIGGSQVVGPQTPAIADPAGGSRIDTEARAAIGAILTALRQHGLVAS